MLPTLFAILTISVLYWLPIRRWRWGASGRVDDDLRDHHVIRCRARQDARVPELHNGIDLRGPVREVHLLWILIRSCDARSTKRHRAEVSSNLPLDA